MDGENATANCSPDFSLKKAFSETLIKNIVIFQQAVFLYREAVASMLFFLNYFIYS